MKQNNGLKLCSKCKIEQSLSNFYKNKANVDGHCYACKDCRKKEIQKKRFCPTKKKLKKSTEFSDGTKLCSTCEERKLLSEFNFSNSNHTAYRPYCRVCQILITKRVKFGISPEEFLKLSKEQNNCCYICNSPNQNHYHLAVDHCHNTGKVRGLLCNNCNSALGFMQDSPDLLLKAAEYLKSHQEPILSNQINTLIPVI